MLKFGVVSLIGGEEGLYLVGHCEEERNKRQTRKNNIMMAQIEKALKLKSDLDKLRPLGKEQEAIIMQKFRLDWNYHSNHLEGNSLTFGETKALILFGITAQGKPLKDHFEITGHDEAIKWVSEIVKGDYPLTENFIRELHKLLLKEPYEVDAITTEGHPTKKHVEVGKYKTIPNHVLTKTGEIFRFATPEETPAQMHDLINWYRMKNDSPDVNPLILSAEFHYRFIRIHPFDDGNGRTARILMNFILMQFGYPPVIIKTEDKDNYFFALRQADTGSIEPFVNYIAENLVRSLEIMIAGASGKSIEEPDDLDKEIALLEQRLKSTGKMSDVKRSKEAILEIYDHSVQKVYRQFIDACEKFDKFYVRTEFWLEARGAVENDKLNSFTRLRNNITAKTNYLLLTYKYISFNHEGFGEFRHESWIELIFDLTRYKLHIQDAIIEHNYGEQLTDKEIGEAVKSETERHKNLIEAKLKEVQQKKSK